MELGLSGTNQLILKYEERIELQAALLAIS